MEGEKRFASAEASKETGLRSENSEAHGTGLDSHSQEPLAPPDVEVYKKETEQRILSAHNAHYPVWLRHETECLALGLTMEQLEEAERQAEARGDRIIGDAYKKAIIIKGSN